MLISRLHIEDYFDACLDVTFIWDFDVLDYWWLNLIALLSVLILILAWLFWSLHMHTLTTVYHLAWHVDSLTVHYFDRLLSMFFLYHYSSWFLYSRLFCVYMMTYLSFSWLRVAWLPSSMWLYAACLCGPHIYPLTSKSLGFGHSFHLGSHYCKYETFCVFALWLSRRLGIGSRDGLYWCTRAFWRWPAHWCREESDHWRPV